MNQTVRTLGWITVIVIAELISFHYLQRSIEDTNNKMLNLLIAMIIFGTFVPLAFRQTLFDGGNMAISNLYWIILSHIGTVLLASIIYEKKIKIYDWITFGVLIISVLIPIFYKS